MPEAITATTSATADAALSYGKKTGRTYVPRIIHIDWGTVHTLIGVASHAAWVILARKYKMIRLKGKFQEHKQLTGQLMRKWCWEIAEKMLAAEPF